jgi:hypothetical protein
MENQLKKEFEFYLEHQEEYVKKHDGKFLVIKDQKLIGSYDTFEEAYIETCKELEPGSFLIQKCTQGSDDYTSTFYSNVSFSLG